MKLIELKVNEFIQVLGSAEPAPGGGSAAALAAAMGISLVKMVGELTTGKKKYSEFEENTQVIIQEAIVLQADLLLAIDKDTDAYNAVDSVFSMPKETAEEKKIRSEALQTALEGAALAPFDLMGTIMSAIHLANRAVGKSNVNAVSDIGVASLNFKAGLQGAWLNVLINLSSIKNEVFVAEYRVKGEQLLAEGNQLADEIYQSVLKLV